MSDEQSPFIETLKVALYGKFGSQKTLQIGHLIDLVGADNVFVVSAEHGLNTIKSKVKTENVITCNSLSDMRSAYARCFKEATPDRWVCLDGMSRVMEWVANEQLIGADRFYDELAKGKRPEELSDDLKPFGRFMTSDGKVDTIRIYGRIGRESQNLLSAWIRLNANIYANYLEDMTGNNGREKTIPWGPDVPGNVGLKAVLSSFDFVMRLFYDDGKLVGGLDPASKIYMARTREDRAELKQPLPLRIEDFDLGAFVGLLREQ